MPRPSLKDQRSGQILDAYLTCVARFGLEGATQERIAAEAGVKRPLLRHYLGNREDMIAALATHVIAAFAEVTEALEAHFAATGTPAELIDALFASGDGHDPRLMLAWQALATAAQNDPDLSRKLTQSYAEFLAVIETVLARAHPGAPPDRIRAAAHGITACIQTIDALEPIAPPATWRTDLKAAALTLATCLGGQT
ncbi:TetR/AcrR family transcriptional regulator [Jhaorihella thermophila]|uniref:DNA-binding transcriptional regulator, AcrR family n=1 Tax=Jhaorihella thermophila TaxID=488547 RepID=A0A1H5UGK1_9RHOB|nr:TetR family transcriptional regulator C-terminal domain-containing protein [Jhaorihella thermophila]SEF74139.1 DNA-binding transcriptional regulator, AcrR family [Jhaorihella thermophila]